MKTLANYNIAIQGLEDRTYMYEFEGNDAFFQAFEQDLIQKGRFIANAILDKSATMIRVKFDIKGVIELICDRSLEPFEESFEAQEQHIYKFGDKYEEITEDLSVVPFGVAMINVAQQIYEFIAITVPMKKLHPKFRTDEDSEEDLLIYSTGGAEEEEEEEKQEEKIDPRWAALNKLKN